LELANSQNPANAARLSGTQGILDRTPPRWALLMLLCLALFVRGRVMLENSTSLSKDPDGYGDVAWHIAREHTFGLSEGDRMAPTASRPPLYPLVLSVFDLLPFRTDPYGYGWLHVMLGMGTVWCTWRLGLAWGLPPGGSLLAAALVAVDPILLGQSAQLMTETMAAFLSAMALLALARDDYAYTPARALAAGVLLGLAALCRTSLLPWAALVAIVFIWRAMAGRQWLPAGLLVAGAVATLAPWAIRNQHVFGRPIITTTHGGYTLLLGNNPEFYDFLRNGTWGSTWDASDILAEWRSHVESHSDGGSVVFDELAADAWAYDRARSHIRDEPLMFAYACLVRWGRLWGILPHQTSADESAARHSLRYAIAIWYAVELPLALVGAWFWRRKLFATPLLWGTLLVLSLSAMHTVYWTDMRMRAPAMVVVALLAARGVVSLALRRRDPNALSVGT
jgi:hypothetical protein